MLHEDDGLTDAWRNGEYRRTVFKVTRRGGKLHIAANASGGGFPESRRRQFRLVFHGIKRKPCIITGHKDTFVRTIDVG